MTITAVLQAPRAFDLTTLARVKLRLGIEDSSDDVRLQELIEAASSKAEEICGRTFAKQTVTETLPVTHRFRQILSETPIQRIVEVRRDGEVLDPPDYLVEDRDAGFLFRENGWITGHQIREQGIGLNRSPQFSEHIWAFDYVAGYHLPSQTGVKNVAIMGATQANPIVITASHGLDDGDEIEIRNVLGMTEINRRRFSVTVIDPTSFSLDDEDGTGHTAYASGGVFTAVPQLPSDLEDTVIQIVRYQFGRDDRDFAVKSERIGDYSASYTTGGEVTGLGPWGLPHEIEKALLRFQRVEMM